KSVEKKYKKCQKVLTTVFTFYFFCSYDNFGMEEQPEDVLIDLITRYGQTIMRARDDLENSKRTVDFGLSRGYSGAQEAKHRMAMAVANFAGGPGRKRKVERRSIKD
ncbi:diuretic hormone class 2, partial [Uranotaenia lowii]|uniref:diuretic hormone class 2 n=1 Tax=Uranotaenia lowii TaxID=190385 RepID=UPI002479E692